jgi:UDP-N-acetylmuramate dehydrogenase
MKLSELTTLRVGGEVQRVLAPHTRDELVATVLDVWADSDDWLILGGGSNVLAGDDDFEGTVVLVRTRGIDVVPVASPHHVFVGGAGRHVAEPAANAADPAATPLVSNAAGPATGATGPTTVRLRVEAGESWDALVAYTVENGLSGIEGLSGIPGSCGAAPIQNIGAYGQEVGDVLASIEFLDFESGELVHIPAAELGLGYRTSVLKQGRQGLVVSIDLDLMVDVAGSASATRSTATSSSATRSTATSDSATSGSATSGSATSGSVIFGGAALSAPIAYPQLASALGVELGDRVPLDEVRRTVLALRASKGMVLDAADSDSVSAGSFFTNPIVSESFAAGLPSDAPRWPIAQEAEPADVVRVIEREGQIDDPDFTGDLAAARTAATQAAAARTPASSRRDVRLVKLSAAWLIEHAGIHRGFSLPGSGAAVSSKHTLALTNRGGATAADITELARYIQMRVLSEYGVRIHAEPVLVGAQL